LSYLDLSFNSISEDTFKAGQIFKPLDGQGPLSLLHLNLAYNNIKSIPNTAFEYLENLDQVLAQNYKNKLERLSLENIFRVGPELVNFLSSRNDSELYRSYAKIIFPTCFASQEISIRMLQ
jgi:Leucine-rich repeat (LRR) protein